MTFSFPGTVAVVTGAAGGIGRALDVAAVGLELAAAYAAGAAGEKAAGQTEDPASTAAPKSQEPSLSGLAGKALRTIGPMISRRLPGNKDT